MTASPRTLLLLLVVAIAIAACQTAPDEFNPIKLLCPGEFDHRSNKCTVPTGGG
jgi:hypothetical protein